MKKAEEIKTVDELTTAEILRQGFAKYRSQLEYGDQRIIAKKSKESERNVREYISNLNVKSTVTGLKIIKAMNELIAERREEAIKQVA